MDPKAFLANNKASVIFLLCGVILISLGFLYPKLNSIQNPVAPELKKAILAIDIGGAVKTPGVYQLDEPLRVEEVIKKAGGFADEADLDWVSKNLNLSQVVKDEMKIYIPKKGEESKQATTATGSLKNSSGQVLGVTNKVNVNTGNEAELDQLPSVGPVTAQKIINGRPYANINNLVEKKIVSKATFEKIKDLIKIE